MNTNQRLAGKVAVVVGGGATGDDPDLPGTGEAAARCMAASAAAVAVVGRTLERSRRTVERIGDSGAAVAVVADATDAASCGSAVAEIVARFGRIDVVVNNLGVASGGSVADTDDVTWDQAIATNLRAPINMTRAAVAHLRAAGAGSVINVGSVAGLQASGAAPYGTTKAAIIGLTREMALSLGPDGIRVNCIVPGHLRTPMGDTGREELRDLRRRLSMLGTEGSGWDVGWTAVFLASDEARYITAASIPVDGGVTEQLTFSAIARLGLV